MTKKFLNVSLQTKILGLIITLILSIIVSLLSIFVYFDIKQIYNNVNKIGLQTAKTISFMPSVKRAFQSTTPSSELQLLATQIENQVDAAFVVIINRDGTILSHPDPNRIGDSIPINDDYKAIVFGGYYNITSDEILGKSLVGKAPILNDRKQIIGVVSVGYLIKDIHASVFDRVMRVLYFAIGIVVIGIIASILLAKNIRKDTLGLEPSQIATLYRDQNAILSSVNEGIIATDQWGRITLINRAAKEILNLTDKVTNKPMTQALPDLHMVETLERKERKLNMEIILEGKVIILNLVPILEAGKIVGSVASFRDKTEVQEMINTLSEVREYSEDLRAQTHEFTNKLYVISGLLQLEYYDDAISMIQEEISINENNNRMIFEQIDDPKVQAILLGKIGKASEKKISFEIDDNSSLGTLPDHIGVAQLTIIIGNLIDNAFDAIANRKQRKVSFFALDFGQDIIFEVTDNGEGILEGEIDSVFKQGYSTKSDQSRGYGLANVIRVVDELGGTVQVNSLKQGTTFTIFIPKRISQEGYV